MAYTTIKKPSSYFNTKLYTGNGTDATAITGVGFQPDWVWIKERSSTSPHKLLDAVRGATKELESNTGNAEATTPTSLQSFDSDGFTVGTNGAVNENTQTYASWNWLANGTGVANTDGDIASTVSANTTSGFSIVQYTGNGTSPSTVGHGLGTTPSMIILKALDSANGWKVYHKSLSTNNILFLHTSDAQATDANYHHSPNNSTFTITGGSSINVNGNRYIAYCFADVQGFSKFGSYTGNGNADGPFIYTGFKPAFLIVKNINAAEAWGMHDNKRPGLGNGNTPVGHFELYPNLSNVENSVGAAGQIDFLSNGFKLRTATNSLNVTQNYIYMAFSSEPLVGDNPATAR